MAKKTKSTEPDRLATIENRLLKMEEIVSQLASAPDPSSSWWFHYWLVHHLQRMPPALPLTGLPALLKEKRREMRETPVAPWKYLVRRQHPWRKQLYITGRNMTARQLVGTIKANHFDEDKAAADFDLPIEAIREALAYVEANKELVETEAEIERLMLKRGGVAHGPQPVPG